MRKTITALAAATVMGLSSAAIAAPVTITFEGIAPTDSFLPVASSDTFTSGDARLTANSEAFIVSDGAAVGFGLVNNGTDYYLDQVNGQFTIDTVSGAAFDLVSFDIGDMDNPTGGGAPFSISVLGVYDGGGAFFDNLVFSPAGFITHTLNASLYSGLTTVVFDIVSAAFPAFDNFVLDIQAANNGGGGGEDPVPAPGALLLLGMGLIGLKSMRRRTA